MASFDYPFDHTFRPLLTPPGPMPLQTGCRAEGVYLTWLTLRGGWAYWLFEGPVQRGQSIEILGAAAQGGLSRPTQKETATTMVLHTSNLTEAEANYVGTIRESISIYWLIHHDDNRAEGIPVTVPAGDAQLWDNRTYTNNFTTTITLPSVRSQRL